MDKVRWHRPVRPGDAIRTEVEVRDLRPSDVITSYSIHYTKLYDYPAPWA